MMMTTIERIARPEQGGLALRSTMLSLALASALALGACGGGKNTYALSGEAQIVGPAGGTLTFANGIILEIPPGAVSEDTEIKITELGCDLAQPALDAPAFRTRRMTCLAGFTGEPDGLTFAVPITAIVPVGPLEPGLVPVQVEFDTELNGVRLAPTDLTYDSAAGVVALHNIMHFSPDWLTTLYQFVEDVCRICETYDNPIIDSEGLTIEQSDLCAAYATDIWAGQQPGCCLLLRSERAKCHPTCDCCMEKLMVVESSGVDATFGDCGIVSSDVWVRYPACPDPAPQEFSESETTPECPDDMTLWIDVQPSTLTLDFGERQNLNDAFTVTLSGKTADGQTAFGPDQLFPRWTSQDPSVAAVSSDDVVRGVAAGTTALEASLSRDPAMPTAKVTVVVNPRGIDGVWHLRPTLQEEQCRFNLGDWFEQNLFGPFDIKIATTDGKDIAAAIVGANSTLTGTWDSTSHAFSLSIDTIEPAECSYLFDLYREDFCIDATRCAFAGCRNMTTVMGHMSPSNTTLTAVVTWYYSITFSGEGTWECEGSARLAGSHD